MVHTWLLLFLLLLLVLLISILLVLLAVVMIIVVSMIKLLQRGVIIIFATTLEHNEVWRALLLSEFFILSNHSPSFTEVVLTLDFLHSSFNKISEDI